MTILRIATTANYSQLVICEDFNLLLIDWHSRQSLNLEMLFTTSFTSAVEEQHVKTATPFRNDQNSCLDLVFTSEQNMVNEVTELPPIGKSDHVCQLWEVVVEEVIFTNKS